MRNSISAFVHKDRRMLMKSWQFEKGKPLSFFLKKNFDRFEIYRNLIKAISIFYAFPRGAQTKKKWEKCVPKHCSQNTTFYKCHKMHTYVYIQITHIRIRWNVCNRNFSASICTKWRKKTLLTTTITDKSTKTTAAPRNWHSWVWESKWRDQLFEKTHTQIYESYGAHQA